MSAARPPRGQALGRCLGWLLLQPCCARGGGWPGPTPTPARVPLPPRVGPGLLTTCSLRELGCGRGRGPSRLPPPGDGGPRVSVVARELLFRAFVAHHKRKQTEGGRTGCPGSAPFRAGPPPRPVPRLEAAECWGRGQWGTSEPWSECEAHTRSPRLSRRHEREGSPSGVPLLVTC